MEHKVYISGIGRCGTTEFATNHQRRKKNV